MVESARSCDVHALALLGRRCYTHPWSVRGFREALRRGEHGLVLVARAPAGADPERGILGYCVIETAADELHLHNLAVRPEYRGGGLGRRLLAIALTIGERRGRAWPCWKRESNRPAIGLYHSMGFLSVAVRATTTAALGGRARLLQGWAPCRGKSAFEFTGSGW